MNVGRYLGRYGDRPYQLTEHIESPCSSLVQFS
jgi:hypothetical protein